MHHDVHCSSIYNTQNVERTQISFSRKMDTKIVVHLHNGVLLNYHNDFMKFLRKWMHLDNIILSEVTQSQKNRHNMQSLIIGY